MRKINDESDSPAANGSRRMSVFGSFGIGLVTGSSSVHHSPLVFVCLACLLSLLAALHSQVGVGVAQIQHHALV
jgi:hypothetical protein